ncbi:MAG: packaged DNA stabilization protein gp10 [Proteobacteria bacterium]|nr:packaged DNA stabilization protein gp10 [Pseudomonadota bacterium]
MLNRVPFATKSTKGRSLPLSVERLINLYPERAPSDAKHSDILYGTPGQTEFCNLPSIRGLHKMRGVLYAVSDETLYSVDEAGVSTSLGSIPGADIVFMADNGTQLCVVTNPNGYIYTVSGGLVEITDPDWPGASSVTYQDGYFAFTKPDTGEMFISALLDGTSINALDFITAESAPDDAVRVISDHRELWIFGEESTEIWYNSGAADFPFERISNAIVEKGLTGPKTPAKVDNTLFWLGEDLIVWRAEGYAPRRISTHAVEQSIKKVVSPENGVGYTYADEGHTFYVLTFPGELTWVYDAATDKWHERQSYNETYWKATTYIYCYGKHLVGGDKIYSLSLDVGTDDGQPIVSKAVSVPYGDNTDPLIMPQFMLDVETGVGNAEDADPQAMLRFSDDGGRTWSNEIWKGLGAVGEYKHRVIWRRLGLFYQRTIEISVSSPVRKAITGAFADVKNG